MTKQPRRAAIAGLVVAALLWLGVVGVAKSVKVYVFSLKISLKAIFYLQGLILWAIFVTSKAGSF